VSVIVVREAGTKASFDSATDSWTVTTPDGHTDIARAVIKARRSDDPTVAIHGMPNYFRVPGPDVERQARFVQRCLDLLERSGATRIEAKSRIVLHRWRPATVANRFYLTHLPPGDDDVYDGPAVLTVGNRDVDVRVRLCGHLAAIDGRYHWRGMVRGELPGDALKGRRNVTISIDGTSTPARLTERTPWGGHTLVGDGLPAFPIGG
jgi:Domain of unknown function (DUF4873)